tara:strand:- start:255 stop:689 length:435 start_codon:yes stop_codon:yes gene_type:complete
MKKILLLLITLTTFTNVSYASFPIDTNKTDTTQVVVQETTEQFHLRMEKQGFDISNCMCVDCRKLKGITKNMNNSNSEVVTLSPAESAKVQIIFLGSVILIGIITISIYVTLPPIIIPIALTMFLLFYLRILLNRMMKEKQLKK